MSLPPVTSTANDASRFRADCPAPAPYLSILALVWLLAAGTAAREGLELTVAARAIQPGEVVALTVSWGKTGPAPATVRASAFGHSFPAYQTGPRRYRALVGIDLEQAPGDYPIAMEVQEGPDRRTVTKTITVRPKTFRTRVLRVPPDYVNPPVDLQERIEREAMLLQSIYSSSSSERLWDAPFLRPVPQPANSAFGTRSVFNDEPRSPHAGTDFLSPAGTPVKAPNAGRVILARELFFTGNTIIIDHGLELFSMLAHFSRIDVHEGDIVRRGELVGLVGATGRVTGPHLHWAVRVGDMRVSAISLLAVAGEPPGRP
jgi:murein DD-endopeptidase MepM/ murein hydrolase activator NlpD